MGKSYRQDNGFGLSFYLLLFLIGICIPAQASYRVYELEVIKYSNKGKPEKPQKVLSMLDPNQYKAYFGTWNQVQVQMLDTWYCPGATNRTEFCPRPKKPTPTRGPASTEPKRATLPAGRAPIVP